MSLRPRLNKYEYSLVRGDGDRVLVIGDLHEPFTKKGYLEFCMQIYKKWNCNKVVLIGDLLDNHYSSFHETDPDGHSAAEEFIRAKKHIQKWYEAFPNAYVCLGNHDLIPQRKAFNGGLSKVWVRTIKEALDVPRWEFAEDFIINGVKYVHGTNRKARQRAKDDFMNVVQGHYHSESYIEFFVGESFKFFAMQVGCGVDRSSYAMAYGKHFKKMHINCGVVIDGELPVLEYMKL